MAWTFDKFLNKFRKKDSIDPSILDAKADLVDGKVPSDQLPSYVDDVLEFANVAGLPATWETGKIYVALDTWYTYRRSGSEYIQIGWQDLPEKATWAEVDTWTDDTKYVTAKAIEDSSYIKASWIPYANASEVNTWTETAKSVTPDALAWSDYGKRIMEIKVVDDATALTTWDWKVVIVIPAELNWWNLVAAHAMVSTVSSSWTPTYQIRNVTQTADMLSTRITIDANEYTSYTAATASVIDTSNDDVATGDRIAIDKDVAGTGEKWDTIVLSFQLP